MSGPVMPKPDAATLARRAEIVADMRIIVPGEGVVETVNEMRAFESDGLTAYRQLPLVVVLPETVREVVTHPEILPRAQHQSGAARFGHVAFRRRAAARRRRAAGDEPLQPHPGHRLSKPRGRRAAWRDQSRHQRCGRPARASTTRRIRRPRSPVRSAAMSLKIRAACTV